MCCKPKVHFGITLLLVITSIVLSSVAFFRHWIHFEINQGLNDNSWDGDIGFLEDYKITPGIEIDRYGYDCLAIDP